MTLTEDRPDALIEQPPHVEPEGVSAVLGKFLANQCDICGMDFTGPQAAPQRGYHMWKEHPVEHAERKAEKAAKAAGRKKPSRRKPPSQRERKPAAGADSTPPPPPKRLTAEKWLSLATMGLAGRLVNGPSPAAGKALAFEAPVFGRALDRAAAGTIVDKWALQPVLKVEQTGKEYGAAFELPLLMFLAERNAGNVAMLQMIEPMCREALEEIVKQMVPVLKEAKREEAKLKEGLDLLSEMDEELGKQEDRIGFILRGFLGIEQEDKGE